ncbi:hypothetical protein KSS87_005613 [Heliosperma pusillum]|nr:hypothetical protein KSS87_005613 [Heliosperma pusillum]
MNMASNVIVKLSTMVYPASDTPNHTITLPSLDTILRLPYSHTLLLYIYPPKTHPSKNPTLNVLQSSLSNILVPYYPLAGRLTRNPKNNHLEITCNAMGVVFVEAETIQYTIDHFGEFTPSHALREVAFPPAWDYSKGLSTFPLLMVQVTRFKCGGVTLGLMVHHSVQDGFAVAQFVNSWSRLVRGLDLEVWPCHNRVRYLGPRQPPQVKFRHFEYEPPVGLSDKSTTCSNVMTTCNLFTFSKSQLSVLKQNPMLKTKTKYLCNTCRTFVEVCDQGT